MHRSGRERLDLGLDRVHSTGLEQHRAGPLNVVAGQVLVAEAMPQHVRACLRGFLQAERHEQGPLALTQVVARGLAGHVGVAEHAEQVVTKLESHADVRAERPQPLHHLGIRARQGSAHLQWPLHCVRGGLHPGHSQRRLGRFVALHLREDVQVLAREHLRAHRLPRLTGRSQTIRRDTRAVEHVVRPRQRDVAEQDRGRHAEPLRGPQPAPFAVQPLERHMHGRRTPADRGSVHQVVVHERTRLDQLQAADRTQHSRSVRLAARATPAPPGERRTDAFAAPQDEFDQRVECVRQLLGEAGHSGLLGRQVLGQGPLDVGSDGLVDGHRMHASIVTPCSVGRRGGVGSPDRLEV